MTFVLKDLATLRAQFNEKKGIFLVAKSAQDIEALSDERKYQIQFLEHILTDLEKQLANFKNNTPNKAPNKESPTAWEQKSKELALVFYAAMYVTQKNIEQHRRRFESNGYLHKLLNNILGTMTEEDYLKCHLALSNHLLSFFKDRNSRYGFEETRLPVDLPKEVLQKFLDPSYALKSEAEKTIFKKIALSKDNKSSVDAKNYRVDSSNPIPDSALAACGKEWSDLQKSLLDLWINAQGKNSAADLSELNNKHRTIQLSFLRAVEESLKAEQVTGINDKEKTAILLGCMHMIREQIGHGEYSHSLLASSETGSKVHKYLTQILGMDIAAVQDIEALVNAAQSYLRFMTIVEPGQIEQNEKRSRNDKGVKNDKAEKEKISAQPMIRAAHFLSAIPGFDLTEWLGLASDISCACKTKALENILLETRVDVTLSSPQTQSSPPFSFFTARTRTTTTPEELPQASTSAGLN